MTTTLQDRPAVDVRMPKRRRIWDVLIAVEVVVGCAAVALDVPPTPTFVLLAMAVASLVARRAHWASYGFHKLQHSGLVLKMLVFAGVWSVFQLGVTMPIANHLSGHRQNFTDFKDLQGNVGMLLGLLLLSWTLAAVGEELAYRGYLQSRMRQLFGGGRIGLFAAVLLSSLLFGFAHTEQGFIGVVVVTIDAVAFSVLRYRYQNLWASVLAHGFNNTIGFITFFLVGPVYAFW